MCLFLFTKKRWFYFLTELHLLVECWYFYLGKRWVKAQGKAQTQPEDPHLPACAEKKVDELTWDFIVGVVWGVHTSHLESGCSPWVSVGCPEQHCNCSPEISVEKILGNVHLLHIIVGFRTKPGTLNHIYPFILTVQTLTTGKAVPNILIAAWAGGRGISV